jgi:Tfp pilus assembly protein PilN
LIPVGAAVGIGVLVFGYMAVMSVRSDTLALNNQNSALTLQIARIRAENKQVSTDIAAREAESAALTVEAGGIQEQIALAQDNERFFNDTLDVLKVNLDASDADIREIINAVPDGVSINSLEYWADGTTVAGLANSEKSILSYAGELRDGGHFDTVTILTIEDLGDGIFGYTIMLR